MENMNTRLDTRVWFRVTGRVNSIYSHGARHPSPPESLASSTRVTQNLIDLSIQKKGRALRNFKRKRKKLAFIPTATPHYTIRLKMSSECSRKHRKVL